MIGLANCVQAGFSTPLYDSLECQSIQLLVRDPPGLSLALSKFKIGVPPSFYHATSLCEHKEPSPLLPGNEQFI